MEKIDWLVAVINRLTNSEIRAWYIKLSNGRLIKIYGED